MDNFPFLNIYNSVAVPFEDIPLLDISRFRKEVIESVEAGARIASLFGFRRRDESLLLIAVIAQDQTGVLSLAAGECGNTYKSLTPDCPQAHWFEREIAEQFGIHPEGHPWLKPIRFHLPFAAEKNKQEQHQGEKEMLPGVTNFFEVEGEEVHEVAVGPVHAGIIEPGHFRFQCHGEKVLHLEISLGYQHRGIEQVIPGGPDKRTIHYMETVAGDTSIGHASAYCHAVEALAGCNISARAQTLRAVALELERLANHTGDLGALSGDIGYLPTASYCGRLRGDFLNMTALLCGSRFGRGFIRPGGTAFDTDEALVSELLKRLERAIEETAGAVNLLWETATVVGRFEETGKLERETCEALGIVGLPARASGIVRDVRFDYPCGYFRFSQIPVSTWGSGDVFARAYVRWLEIQRSADFIRQELKTMPGEKVKTDIGKLSSDAVVVSLIEGWRGEICHVGITDENGRFSRYKIVDPSFHNWFGLAMAMRNEEISDFPLCNKSFNLSYCGHDL